MGPGSEKSMVYYGQSAHTYEMQFHFGCLRFFNSGSLYCESCQKIVSAAFKCNDKDYHMQGLGLFLSEMHGCMSFQLTLKKF